MPWQLFAFLNVLGSSTYVLLARSGLASKRHDPTAFAIGVPLVSGLTCGVIALLLGNANFNYTQLSALHLFISFAGNMVQFVLTAKALSLMEAGPFSILLNVRMIFMIAFGALFLHDRITLTLVIGAALILIGATVVHYRKGHVFQLGKGEIYTLLATVFFAIPFVNDAYLLRGGYDAASYLAFAFTAPALGLIFVYPNAARSLFRTPAKILLKDIVPAGSILGAAVVAIFLAFQKTSNSSVLAAIAQSSAVFTVIGAAVFLKERDYLKKKAVATLIVFAGLIVVSI